MVISATEFKAKCLELMDLVNETGETIQITKRGKVVAWLTAADVNRKRFRENLGIAREHIKGYRIGELDLDNVESDLNEDEWLKKWDEKLK